MLELTLIQLCTLLLALERLLEVCDLPLQAFDDLSLSLLLAKPNSATRLRVEVCRHHHTLFASR